MIKELTNLCKNTNSNQAAAFVPHTTHINSQQALFQPIIDLLERCKLQKTLLHCFHSTINTPQVKTLAQCILNNTRSYSASNSFSSLADLNYEIVNCRKQIQYSYMSELMDAVENLTQLERVLNDFQTLAKIQRGSGQLNGNGLPLTQLPMKASPIVTSTMSAMDGKMNGTTEDDFLLTSNKKLLNVQVITVFFN